VLVPGNVDSAGSQFFICVTDQPQLDGQYTAFGRVVEGFEVLEKISMQSTSAAQQLLQRVEISRTLERDRPPVEMPPFAEVPVESLSDYRVELYTTLGRIEIGFYPESAPEHVRQFLRFAQLGLYDGTSFHRVVPGFVVQGGAFSSRKAAIEEKDRKYLRTLNAEFSELKHVPGAVSMARGADADSAMDSFFIVLAAAEFLDGEYTVFGHVVKGMEVVDGIGQVPVRGETPLVPVLIEKVTVRK
jgi:peptidyl-prolyl cis-trans isomerase B (cyclophilin B)